jgi:hypothetical protein
LNAESVTNPKLILNTRSYSGDGVYLKFWDYPEHTVQLILSAPIYRKQRAYPDYRDHPEQRAFLEYRAYPEYRDYPESTASLEHRDCHDTGHMTQEAISNS